MLVSVAHLRVHHGLSVDVHRCLQEQMTEYTTLTTMKRHPNLLSLIGGVVSHHQVWLVFTFVPGGSLAARLLQDPTWGRTDLVRSLTVALGMAAGVAALHAQGYLHRDCTSRVTAFLLPAFFLDACHACF